VYPGLNCLTKTPVQSETPLGRKTWTRELLLDNEPQDVEQEQERHDADVHDNQYPVFYQDQVLVVNPADNPANPGNQQDVKDLNFATVQAPTATNVCEYDSGTTGNNQNQNPVLIAGTTHLFYMAEERTLLPEPFRGTPDQDVSEFWRRLTT